ncbi:MAG: hypothetical protein GY950_21940 [bacterium]|nr:hypothetical protein [bacterium]
MTFKKMTFKKILPYILIVFLSLALWNTHGSAAPYPQDPQDPKKAQDRDVKQINDKSYTVGPQDLITINVFGVEALNRQVRISGNGTITLPLLGEIQVGGLTTAQLEIKLARLLESKYLKNAQVTVFIVEYQAKKVAVIGAVQTPGRYELMGKETLLQVISRAGGLTGTAADRVVLIRKDKSKIIDLEELMMKGTPEANIRLIPGDIVNIPHERYIDIYIFGQVQHPGTLRIKKSGQTSLLKAIAQAGGFTARARKGAIVIKRTVKGKQIKIKINVKKILKGKKPAFVLHHDDIVYVPESLL